MGNQVFNVNGSGVELLSKALDLVFTQAGYSPEKCVAWKETKEDGLILLWSENDGAHKLPAPLLAKECLPMIESWLKSDFAKTVKLGDWCNNKDHDGHNSIGWQVYVGDWGHVGFERYAICAIRPAYIWHGK